MTIQQLSRLLCKKEGLKAQVNIAQMNEILGHLSDIAFSSPDFNFLLFRNGMRRAMKRAKPKPSRKLTKSEQRRLEVMGKGKKEVRK